MALRIYAGPAGVGKSQAIAESADPLRDTIIETQPILAALTGATRDGQGNWPVVPADDPRRRLAVAVKNAAIAIAVERELHRSADVYTCTSSVDELDRLRGRFPDAQVSLLEISEDEALERLGSRYPNHRRDCANAVSRWFRRGYLDGGRGGGRRR